MNRPARGMARFYDERLTPQQNKAAEMAFNGFRIDEIADEMDISHNHVSSILCMARKAGVNVYAARSRRLTWSNAEIFALREQGLTYAQISERTGLSKTNISVRLFKERKRLGIAAVATKWITDEVLRQWFAMQREGLSAREIGAKWGVSRHSVLGAMSRARHRTKTDERRAA